MPNALLKVGQRYSHLLLLCFRSDAVPIQQLQVPNEFQQEQQLGQIRQQGQLLQEEQQQQQQQQQHVAEEQTLQPISFDRFSAMPIKEVLGIFNNPTGVIKASVRNGLAL